MERLVSWIIDSYSMPDAEIFRRYWTDVRIVSMCCPIRELSSMEILRGWLHIVGVSHAVNQGQSIICDLHQKAIQTELVKKERGLNRDEFTFARH